jgi:hypothetical protein
MVVPSHHHNIKSPPDVGKFLEILDDDIVKMMALCYG